MPGETAIVVTILTATFLIFAAVLFWADRQTRNLPHDR